MTFERRIVVSLGDIKLVCYECKSKGCRAKVCVSPDSSMEPPERCPQCKAEWQKRYDPQDDKRTPPTLIERGKQPSVVQLVRAVADMRNHEIAGPLGFRILLEFEETSATLS